MLVVGAVWGATIAVAVMWKPPASQWPWPLSSIGKVAGAWWVLAWGEYSMVQYVASMTGVTFISP
eukprot:14603172-Alexandrium_andersonii.AAC.1